MGKGEKVDKKGVNQKPDKAGGTTPGPLLTRIGR
jgi:hypothetical protein